MTNTTSVESPSGGDNDKTTFGPSAAAKGVLELLVNQGHFKTSLGAFQAAAMLALRKGFNPNSAAPSAGTMWNRGSVNQQVRDFLSWYVPTEMPIRLLEQLGNVGIEYIAEKVTNGGYNLTEIFELPRLAIE